LTAAAGLAVAGITSPAAQELTGPIVGPLDCRAAGKRLPALKLKMRCTIFLRQRNFAGYRVFTGQLSRPGLLQRTSGGRAVWLVTARERNLNLNGAYVRATSGRERLEGGTANSTELFPSEDVPFEDVGPNLAVGASGLTLQAQ
jgi:hypothetical protein